MLAKHGVKMITLHIRFRTAGIANESGHIEPKHAWVGGWIDAAANEAHGIVNDYSAPFNSLSEIPATIEKVLMHHGIILHLSGKMGKYVAE